VIVAAVWGAVVIWFGLNHDGLVQGNWHWVIQVIHLLVGLAAVGQAEGLGSRIRETAPVAPAAP
jgi:hypothetical protein